MYFWTGLALMYLVTQTQFEYYAEHEFFMHQLQSMVLHHMGPLLMVLAWPKRLFLQALPATCQVLVNKASAQPSVRVFLAVCFHPMILVSSFVGLLVFWLLPPIHFVSMLDWRLYRLMNLSMVISGLMFWGAVLDAGSKYPAGWRILTMLAIVPPQIMLGLFLFLTGHDMYPVYRLCGRAFGQFSAVNDQQLGGLILWSQAAMMSVLGIFVVLRTELFNNSRTENPKPKA